MSIIRNPGDVRRVYREAAEKKWVIPCICTENLTTTEAILTAAEEFRVENGLDRVPITIAMTCRYDHRSQAVNYTSTKRWDIGLRLFTESLKILCDGENAPFSRLDVMIHLDHIQFDLDSELLSWDLSDYASIMYDASALPFEENIKRTAEFVKRRGSDIVIEGACDEIVDATGSVRNALTTPERAKRFVSLTGVDFAVCNLGTEHRATGKELSYHGDVSRQIKAVIGEKIVLHGTSSVPNSQIAKLFDDGICKVNIWTALERDSSPVLLREMTRNAARVAGTAKVKELIAEGLLPESADTGEPASIACFTSLYRNGIVSEYMKKAVREYLDMWYR